MPGGWLGQAAVFHVAGHRPWAAVGELPGARVPVLSAPAAPAGPGVQTEKNEAHSTSSRWECMSPFLGLFSFFVLTAVVKNKETKVNKGLPSQDT